MQPLSGNLENTTYAFKFSKNISLNSFNSFQDQSTSSSNLNDQSLLENNNNNHNNNDQCPNDEEVWYSSFFGVTLALPEWEAALTAFMLSIIIVLTIVGNVLVILSVFTYKPLRIVQNFFIVSLAVADLTVALLVLPFNVAYSILGRWEFGIHLCKLWLTCDVMCCTSSILNLCIIALDRFWAITDPINYAYKRTVNRVLFLIAGVWILSFIISSPPLFGWNDWPDEFLSTTPCELTSNRGYVIYSSLGSFFIPLIIMTIVYVEIYIAAKRRLRERGLASKMYNISVKTNDLNLTEDSIAQEKISTPSFTSSLLCCGCDSTKSKCFNAQNDTVSISSETRVSAQQQQQQEQQQQPKDDPTTKHSIEFKHIVIKDSIKKKMNLKHICIPPHDDNNQGTSSTSSSSHAKDTQIEMIALGNVKNPMEKEIKEMDSSFQQQQQQSTVVSVRNDEKILEKTKLSQSQSQLIEPCPCDLAVTIEKKSSTGQFNQFIEEKQKISLSKERRAARTLGIIMGVFVICWLPFFLMYVILPFCGTCCPTQKFKNFITWLGYINSSLNPIIYTIFNLDFRRAFKTLLGLK